MIANTRMIVKNTKRLHITVCKCLKEVESVGRSASAFSFLHGSKSFFSPFLRTCDQNLVSCEHKKIQRFFPDANNS
jgi:hypothetical protein